MARASVWGLGTALAYRGLDLTAQAELFTLFVAHRMAEADEAKVVLASSLIEIGNAFITAYRNSDGPQPAPPSVPSAQKRGRGSPESQFPAIARPRASIQELLAEAVGE